MSLKTSTKTNRCAMCGNKLRATTITHEEKRGNKLYIFQNVPAQVCEECAEIWIEEKTLQAIDRLIKEGEPTRTVETPVYDFAHATVK
jgi:YgiT-type zinc finger domain-containing protein